MHSDKKITKEDTWKPSDLKRHIREEGYSDDYYSKQDSNETKHRSGDSKDKQRKDLEKESRRERDKHREHESTRDRQAHDKKDKYAERRKEGSRDRRGNREKDRRDDRDVEKRREKDRQVDENKYNDDYREKRRERERLVDEDKHSDDYREKKDRRREREQLVDEDKHSDEYRKNRDRRRDRESLVDENKKSDDYREYKDSRRDKEDKHRDRDKERHRNKDKERVRDRDRYNDEDREKNREDGDKVKRREQRDREHRSEKRRHDGNGEEKKDWIEKSDKDLRDQRHRERDRHKGEYEERSNEKETRKKHGDRKHSEEKEQREYRVHRAQREDREQRQRERKKDDGKLKNSSDSLKKQDLKVSPEEVRHCRGDRERAEWDIHKEKRHRKGKDVEKKQRGRSHREGEDSEKKQRQKNYREGQDPENNQKENSRGEGENTENKQREIYNIEGEDPENKQREMYNREGEDPENNQKESSHRLGEDPENKQRESSHGEGEEPENKLRERSHREVEDPEINQKERNHVLREDPENKVRERGQREEQNHRFRTSSKRFSSDISQRHGRNTPKTENVIDEDFGEQEYENDFEDYEDDFEEMDESADEGEDEKETHPSQVREESQEHTLQRRKEIEAIQKAMEEENERVGTAQPRQSTSREEKEESFETKQGRSSQRGKFINFVVAKQHEVSKKVATKQKKRSTELLRLIDLDFSLTFSLLDLPPVNEYEMYIRNFGSANTKQAYAQCNEDNIDRDVQTEEILLCEKWTQHPPEHSGACGDPNLSQEAGKKNIGEPNLDLKRLTAFLSSAAQVMVVLLEEDQAERRSLKELRTQTDTLSFSDGSLQLNTMLPFLYGRHISLVHFSQVQRHTMMSVHMPADKPSDVRLERCSIICIWNIWEPSRPQKILVYESEVQCCCFSPGKATLVFAGTSVGSVVLWDLRENASNHYQMMIGEDEWTFRQPSFSTDAVMADSGHLSSVTSVEVVPSGVSGGTKPEVPMLVFDEDSSGLSFQLASLDETGVLNFWVVVELPKANEAGSPTDLGLRPGSKVKLLHSSSLLTVNSVSPQDTIKTGPLQTLHLKFLPTDSSHFFIGTNMGLVHHGTSHGLKAAPNIYRFQEHGVRPVEVSSIHFSPFKQSMFLVGCGDGSIRLHVLSHEQPVAECNSSTAGEPVVSLQWAQTRPTVFCVLDAASNLHIWDLLKNETEPVLTERMNTDRVTAMAVFGDSGQQNIYSGIALAHKSGKIEMQYFTRNLTLPVSEEEEKLESLITEVF